MIISTQNLSYINPNGTPNPFKGTLGLPLKAPLAVPNTYMAQLGGQFAVLPALGRSAGGGDPADLPGREGAGRGLGPQRSHEYKDAKMIYSLCSRVFGIWYIVHGIFK